MHGADDAADVDAGMAVEALVLGREEGVDHPLGDRADRHEDALLDRIFGQQPPVARKHAGHHRRIVFGELGIVRQVGRIALDDQIAGDAARGEQSQPQNEEETEVSKETHRSSLGPWRHSNQDRVPLAISV